ncbi:baculoviral IAP repeat-containing protein 3-like [Mercenaria mercenaria]|uniref:baculoviral IAP repeat-containing protein 3-like n=1 Tax=Mercenaria mercenaria TaxID=6596 RepID=UPI00234E80F9|nr:baculoviral IAP repeat-containing protein 3-like [Mercenaria mercenaria]XP_045195699.2 baculoviral IAP repeat-containing protein 3-like [Mercenaria mercenaria]XP_045195700.2 baculoviral IAP repeat-containing protein 3-like [Mercenaria mercenaria]XP_045195701.2 baculoviral IAP repeat-containing protein 3-like [Mercenaria mercenaria]
MSECSDVKVTPQNAVRPPPIALGINVEKPKFPQYALVPKRFESFKEWPEHIPVDKEALVEAGLVYTGVGDSVRCFFCGGGLRNWECGDVPMEEHAKWYPKCPHILLVKGQEYVDKLIRGEKPDAEEVDNTKKSSASETNLLGSVAARSCIEMGFAEELVKEAINIFIEKQGNTDFKGADLCEILFDLEESQDVTVLTDKLEDCVVDDNDKIEPLETLLEENHRLKENQLCKICLDSRADVIFLPCGHRVCCPQCAPALTKCPVCRQTVNGQIKAFFATTFSSSQEN